MDSSDAATAYALVADKDYGAYIWSAYAIAFAALGGLLIWSILRTRALERRAAEQRRAMPADEDFR